jgi:uncharacterized protein (DUF2062 family)
VIGPIVHQLTQGITPEKIALTLAVGSACALFPLVGTTTVLCLIVGIVLRLNQPIIQIVNGLCWPVHIPAILGMLRLGNWLFGVPRASINMRIINQMFWVLWDTPRLFVERYGTIAWHAIIGWAVLAPFWMAIVYVIAVPVLREVVRQRAAGTLQSDSGEPPVHPVP